MEKLRILFVGVLILLFVGCPVRSIFPLFADKDMVFVPGLVGKWINTTKDQGGAKPRGKVQIDTEEVLSIKRAGEHNYYLMEFPEQKDDGQVEIKTYYGYVGRLGDFWFLDACQYIREHENNDLIPTHYLCRFWLEGDAFRVAFLDGDWLDKMIGERKISISRLGSQWDQVLTAETPELQQLVQRFAKDPEAFPDPDTLVRLK